VVWVVDAALEHEGHRVLGNRSEYFFRLVRTKIYLTFDQAAGQIINNHPLSDK